MKRKGRPSPATPPHSTVSEVTPTTTTHSAPSGSRVAIVTSVAAVASVLANAALVWMAETLDASLESYSHFRLYDYGSLTVVGVACAGGAWFFVARHVASPRATFFRIALWVTVVLWLPDVWLLLKHEPTRAVIFLIIMHVIVALITYNLLVFVAPMVRRESTSATVVNAPVRLDESADGHATKRVPHVVWVALMIAVGVEFLVGLVGMLYVPFSRPNGWLVPKGETLYLFHAALGGLLGVAALLVVLRVSQQTSVHRIDRIAAISGLWGMLVGAVGGVLCVIHSLRLVGLALMFVGVSVAFFGYLMPMIDEAPVTAPGETQSEL